MPKPLTEHHAGCAGLSVMIHRRSGVQQTASVTRLWLDGCEITTAESFEPAEPVEIELGAMGRIRAHVAGCVSGILFIRFDREFPV